MRVMNIMLSKGQGGIEVAFAHYATALAHAEIETICCMAAGMHPATHISPTIPVTHIAHASQFDPRSIWRAIQLIRIHTPEILIVHGRRAFIIFALAKKIMRSKTPIVQVLHRPRFKNLRSAQHVITVSAALRAQTIAHGLTPQQVTHIPNFLPDLKVSETHQSWHTPPVIGLLSRFVPVKGVDIFINALAILKQRGLTPHVHIGGDGEDAASLKQQATSQGVADQITWLGWVEDTHAFYQSIDLFCLPSRAESFGLVVLEAFAAGVPIIATHTSGPSEIIRHRETGWLCDITPEALADALAEALQNETDAKRWAHAARKECAFFTLEAIAPRIKQCLEQTLAAAH